jgi:hypothetical protein
VMPNVNSSKLSAFVKEIKERKSHNPAVPQWTLLQFDSFEKWHYSVCHTAPHCPERCDGIGSQILNEGDLWVRLSGLWFERGFLKIVSWELSIWDREQTKSEKTWRLNEWISL